ncbi:unnamed protein product, partial [Rotaria socialis]
MSIKDDDSIQTVAQPHLPLHIRQQIADWKRHAQHAGNESTKNDSHHLSMPTPHTMIETGLTFHRDIKEGSQ